ncbi:porin [Vandammella animalimorsus]|uniref:Porin n=1 Tax=Vandammella animalimorsus TaxID=2029117 RepID=A0A2A2ARB3_9BURK|nr:porin [Vandammella animalimorsus]PAT35637.1 porin [Vandammella animalimorsus]PAT40179.1 porin [Vandammella animalimorsus]
MSIPRRPRHALRTTALAAGLLGLGSLLPAQAQSSVQLYGIIDAAVRYTTNEGPAGDHKQSQTKMIGGGMSQSRLGINVTEQLGDGFKVLANLEQRIDSTSGNIVGAGYQQAWVGLQHKRFGRLTAGRQYNALFDLYTSTFASYPYSPYMEAFKPEIGMSLGARNNELLKYLAEFGKVRVSLQATLDGEGSTSVPGVPGTYSTGGKSRGGYVRYADGGLAIGAGYMERSFGSSGKKIKAYAVGGSYRTGPWYLNAAYAQNKHNLDGQANCGANIQCNVDYATLSSLWTGTSNGGFSGPAFTVANKRQMITAGVGYQITPQLNWGTHYWYAKQSGRSAVADGTAHFLSTVLDYAFSKRTDAYIGLDHIKISSDHASLTDSRGAVNGAKSRTGLTVGIRHRF